MALEEPLPSYPNKPDTSNLDAIYELQHRDKDPHSYYMENYGVPINYEDDFKNKTKWVKKTTNPRGGGRGRGR